MAALSDGERSIVRAFLWGVLILGSLFAVVCVNAGSGEDNPRYDNCAAAVERSGVPEGSPDFMLRVGQCLERLDSD